MQAQFQQPQFLLRRSRCGGKGALEESRRDGPAFRFKGGGCEAVVSSVFNLLPSICQFRCLFLALAIMVSIVTTSSGR